MSDDNFEIWFKNKYTKRMSFINREPHYQRIKYVQFGIQNDSEISK